MELKRRDFIKGIGGTGAGILASAITSQSEPVIKQPPISNMQPIFNMSGYASARLDKINVGFIGVGNRGMTAVSRLLKIEGVEIKAICDLRESQVEKAINLAKAAGHRPTGYFGNENEWKKLCDRNDLDLIYILTPWKLHTPQAIRAMETGKHAFVEVPAALTLEECWALVETSERTKKHCVQVENCCYDFAELLTLNMAQQGFFGEVTHCEGGYIHPLKDLIFDQNRFYQNWQLKESIGKKGCLYPTHGLGPVAQVLNINRGDQFKFLTSVSSHDFHFQEYAEQLVSTNEYYRPFVLDQYNGTTNTTTIKTVKGKTIVIQYDISSPRPYTRNFMVSGTKAFAQKYPEPMRIAVGHNWIKDDEYKKLEKKYMPPIIQKIGEIAKQIGGHGGMDFLMDWRNIDCLRNGLPMDQDVYDAAAWSSVIPLSIESVQKQSDSIPFPDFTRSNWKQNTPVDLSMKTGGTTRILT